MCCVLYVRTLEGGIWLSRSPAPTGRVDDPSLVFTYSASLCFFWLRREREVRRRLKKEADRPSSVSLFSAPSRLKDGEYSFLALNGGGRHRVLFSSASSAPHNVRIAVAAAPRALLPSSIPRQKLISPPILCIYCNALFRSNIPRRRGWLFHGPDASPLSADNRQCIVRVRVRSLTIAAAPQPHQSLVANKSLSKDPESFPSGPA